MSSLPFHQPADSPLPPQSVASLYPDQAMLGTTREVVRAYLEAKQVRLKLGKYDPKSYRRAEDYLTHFLNDLGNRPIGVCRGADLERWLAMHPEWKSPFTQTDAIGAVVTCFKWAADEVLIHRCPYKRPRDLIDTLEPRAAISADQVGRLLQVLRRPIRRPRRSTRVRHRPRGVSSRSLVRVCLLFLWETGARPGEAWQKADWQHLDWNAQTVLVAKPKNFRKVGKPRALVWTNPRLTRLLRCLWRMQGHPVSGPIFRNSRKTAWRSSTFARHFRKFAELVGIPDEISAYSLRHGYIQLGIKNKVGNKQMADSAGHTTTRYVDSWYGRSTIEDTDYLRETNRQTHRR